MSENECKTKGCTNHKYNEYDRCIFHCEKENFDDEDIKYFWNQIRLLINSQKFHNSYFNENIELNNIVFPKFEQSEYYNYIKNFHRFNTIFQQSSILKFTKCKFIDNFDLLQSNIESKLIFDNCHFHGDIKSQNINNLELLNCIFHKDFLLENTICGNLKIKNTKFIKNFNISINKSLEILENCIFRNESIISGKNSPTLNIEESQFDKKLTIKNTKRPLYIPIQLKKNYYLMKQIMKLI